jgi:AraC-like DNA-binding protein
LPFGVQSHLCRTRGTQHHSDGLRHQYVVTSQMLFPLAELLIEELERRDPMAETSAASYLLTLFCLLQRTETETKLAAPYTVLARDVDQRSQSGSKIRKADTTASNPEEELNEELGTGDESETTPGKSTATRRLRPSEPQLIVRRAQQYIDSNIGNPLNLQEIAHASYVSRARLAKLFRDHLGSVWEYVTRRRIEEAKVMLVETDIYVYEISRLCGFSHQSAFYARFLEHTGLPPHEYRLQQRQKGTVAEKRAG